MDGWGWVLIWKAGESLVTKRQNSAVVSAAAPEPVRRNAESERNQINLITNKLYLIYYFSIDYNFLNIL